MQVQTLEHESHQKNDHITCLEEQVSRQNEFTQVIQGLNEKLLSQVSTLSQKFVSATHTLSRG